MFYFWVSIIYSLTLWLDVDIMYRRIFKDGIKACIVFIVSIFDIVRLEVFILCLLYKIKMK